MEKVIGFNHFFLFDFNINVIKNCTVIVYCYNCFIMTEFEKQSTILRYFHASNYTYLNQVQYLFALKILNFLFISSPIIQSIFLD